MNAQINNQDHSLSAQAGYYVKQKPDRVPRAAEHLAVPLAASLAVTLAIFTLARLFWTRIEQKYWTFRQKLIIILFSDFQENLAHNVFFQIVAEHRQMFIGSRYDKRRGGERGTQNMR